MLGVDEELGSTGARLAGVGHGQSSDVVTDLGAVRLLELIGDGTTAVTSDGANAGNIVGGLRGRSAGTSSARVGVTRVGAAELVHEVGNHTVEVETIVETSVGKVDEVVCEDVKRGSRFSACMIGDVVVSEYLQQVTGS